MPNNHLLNEGLQYKDMVGLIKPTIHIDEFVSKMGEDDDIMVLSFYTRSDMATDDLISWFEKGYDFVLDADRSPGEVQPNRFLVYVELQRRTYVLRQMEELLDDLTTLTEHKITDWTVVYDGEEMPFDEEILSKKLVLSPQSWREKEEREESELNEMRTAANIPAKKVLKRKDPELDIIRQQAGIL